jgi:hypothetical protein
VLDTGIDRSGEQRHLARQRKPDAFQAYNRANGEKPIVVDQILKKFHAGRSDLFSS